MLEPLPEWPTYGHDHAVQNFDNSTFHSHSAESPPQHELTYAADSYQQNPPNSPKPALKPHHHLTSETQDAIERWRYAPHTSVQHPTVHRPVPQYPHGYNNRKIDHLPLVDGRTTPDESTSDATPPLTDSQSEPLPSPAVEDLFTFISESLQNENTSQQTQPPLEPQAPYFSTHFAPGAFNEDESALKNVREAQAQALEYYQPSNIHITEYPNMVTHVVPLKFSRERYNALLQTRSPLPQEVKTPSDKDPYSFTTLDRRGCHPIISISETGGDLSNITIDFNGTITMLTEDNFCRIEGCGYWSKNAGRVPRHRLTHFTDRGFECQNPVRKGADAPKHLQCQLGPGQYLTRLDLFKKHCRTPSCQKYAPSLIQDLQRNFWRGPDSVDELYLLPFTRDIHIPFILRTPKP